MMELTGVIILIIVFIFFIGFSIMSVISVSKSLAKCNEKKEKYKYWLNNIEPKLRNYDGYPEDWEMRVAHVKKRDGDRCQDCGTNSFYRFNVHHKIPLSKGGDNSFENLVYLCEKCHEKYHPHLYHEGRQRRRNFIENKNKRSAINQA